MSDKTEQPTPKRLQDARREGQLARSRFFSASVVAFAGLVGLGWSGQRAARDLTDWSRRNWEVGSSSLEGRAVLLDAAALLARVSLVPLVAVFVASVAVSLTQAGFQWRVAWLAPKWERVSMGKGFARVFSLRPLQELGKLSLYAGTLLACAYFMARPILAASARSLMHPSMSPGAVLLSEVWRMCRNLAAVAALLGIADYGWARRQFLRGLRMSREELKQEHKSSEGDPHHRGQRKAIHRQLALGGPARGVGQASAIVVNPTHIAIAIRYSEPECEAPYLVAKGRDEDALALKRQAQALGVPVVQDIPLARSLIHFDVGESIPEELYEAAAVVLRVAAERLTTAPKDPRSLS